MLNFEALCIQKHLNVHIHLEEFSFNIHKDDFIRAFNNLVSNAIKYNKISGKLSIVLKNSSLEIKDTGLGIEKNKLKDIFKRYYRATTQQGGFGMA